MTTTPTDPAPDAIDAAANVAANLATITARIDAAAGDYATGLIAVSKRQPAARIEAALAAGHRRFGENRVQEAAARWPALTARWPDVELHLVGALQSNKAGEAVALFDVIHTVDRPKLARALKREMAAQDRHPRLLIQVNTGEEPQKGGVAPSELAALIALCRDELDLPVEGLMCLPPVDDEPALHFALLIELARRHGLATLSMGMSEDFETAAAMGATWVRVGTAIFGPRQVGGG